MAWAAIEPAEYNGVGPRLAVGCSKSENHLCEQIPGCNYDKKDGIWKVPLSWPGYVAFRTVWGSQPVTEAPGLLEWASGAWSRVQQAYQLRSALDCGPAVRTELEDIEGGKRLFGFQRGGVQWLTSMGRTILEDPQGNGKTPQLIRSLQVLAGRKDSPLPTLIIAPGAALYGWRDELAAWAPEFSVKIIEGTALRRRRVLEDEEPADVYLIAWPNVRLHTRLGRYYGQAFVRCDEHGGVTGKTIAQCEVHEKELNAISWGTVIADEAHRMKDARSKQTRAVWHLMHSARFAWPVTGTPVSDNIGDLWPLLHAVDPLAWPAKSRYLDLYAVKGYAWGGRGVEVLDIRPDTAAAFHASVQPLMRRIPKEIARPQMPPRLPPVFRYPELTPKQATAYRQLRKEALAELEGATVVPRNALVAFGRSCQLASAMIETRDGEDRDGFTTQEVDLVLPSSKVDDLIDFLGDNPGQLVVAANSPRLVELAEKRLSDPKHKITHCKIVGGMSPAESAQAREWFQAGDCRVIFLTSAGAESITLTASDTVFFLQPDPSFLSREQKIGRVDRIGQPSAVRVINSITPGTVEERLYKLGCEKEERAGSVTRDADLMRWILTGEDHGAQAQRPASEQGQEPLW